jgi:hypothetical protein
MTHPPRALDLRLQTNRTTSDKRSNKLTRHLRGAVRLARTSGPIVRRRSARAVKATRIGVGWTARRVQALPISTRRSLATGSVGLGAGLFFGGAPRLVAATGVTPAVLIGAAMLLRPETQVSGVGSTP